MKNAKVYHGGGGKGKGFSSNGAGDSFTVKATTNDTTANFLKSKLASTNSNLTIALLNAGANEIVTLQAETQAGDHKLMVSGSDVMPNYLESKLLAGRDMYFNKIGGGGTEMFEIGSFARVRSVAEDDNPDFLLSKISAGVGIEKNLVQPSDRKVEISAPLITKLKNSINDTTPDYLLSKVQAGTNVTLATANAGANEKLIINATTQNGDHLVKTDASDSSPAPLNSKILAGSNILVTNLQTPTPHLVIDAYPQLGDGNVLVSSGDTTRNFLASKLVAGSNITLTKQNAGANENIKISASGADVGYPLNWGTGLGLSVGAFITPCTEGSSWANGNIGQLIRKAGTLNRICVMLPRFVSYNASDSITFQVRRIAASSALGASALSASSGVALGTIAVTCPVTSGAFWYNNFNSSDVSWSLSANDIVFIVVSAMTVNAVTGVSIYTLINE